MPIVAILNRAERRFTEFHSKEFGLADALIAAGLKPGEIDFGTLSKYRNQPRNYSIILYEYGLIKGAESDYWRMGKQLFNGNAVIFKTDDEGKTVDFPPAVLEHMNAQFPEIEFFDSIAEVELAILAGRVARPQTSINGEVIWTWKGTKE